MTPGNRSQFRAGPPARHEGEGTARIFPFFFDEFPLRPPPSPPCPPQSCHRRSPVTAAVLSPPQSCHRRSPVDHRCPVPARGRAIPPYPPDTGAEKRHGKAAREPHGAPSGRGWRVAWPPHHGLAGGWEPPKRYLGTGGEMIPPSTPTSFELAFSGTMFSGQLIHLEAFVDDVLKDSCFRFRTIRNVFLSGCNN